LIEKREKERERYEDCKKQRSGYQRKYLDGITICKREIKGGGELEAFFT
jgi:hypothetical protein